MILEREWLDDSDDERYVDNVITFGYIGNIILKLTWHLPYHKTRKGFRLAKKILLLIRQLYRFFFNKNLNLNWMYI